MAECVTPAITMPEGAFNADFGPIARPGDMVKLAPDRGFHVVSNYNVQPGLDFEQAFTVADGAREKKELTELEMDDGYLLQTRMLQLAEELPDGVSITVDHDGKQSPLYEAKNERGEITNETGSVYGFDPTQNSNVLDHFHSKLTEMFVWEDNPPYFTFSNTSGASVDIDLTFTGYVFDLTSVEKEKVDGTPVSVPTKALR